MSAPPSWRDTLGCWMSYSVTIFLFVKDPLPPVSAGASPEMYLHIRRETPKLVQRLLLMSPPLSFSSSHPPYPHLPSPLREQIIHLTFLILPFRIMSQAMESSLGVGGVVGITPTMYLVIRYKAENIYCIAIFLSTATWNIYYFFF